MKSLNDIVWNGDIDLEGEKNNIEILGMSYACLEQSCNYLDPACKIELSYVLYATCK